MHAPLVPYLRGLAALLPLLAALAARRAGRGLAWPLRLVAASAAVTGATVVLIGWLHAHDRSIYWVSHVALPVQTTLLLWAFAGWQRTERAHLTLRLAVPLFVAVWLALLLTVEDTGHFSDITRPLQAMLLVAVAAWTVLQRARVSQGLVVREPWLWVGLGTMVHYGPDAAFGPVANALLALGSDELRLVFTIKAGIELLASLFFAWGILCWRRYPRPRYPRSSGSFSPLAASPSSWPPPSSAP